MVRIASALVFALSLITTALAASSWSFSDAVLTVGPKGKEPTVSHTFGPKSPVDDVVELASTDTLRLTFTTNEGSTAARPHQSFVLIKDSSTNLELAVPVAVKSSGKAKFDLDSRDLPPSLWCAETLDLTLAIASFGESTPLKLGIASIKPVPNPSSCENLETPVRWGPEPEITHTFREPQKLPNKTLSAIFTLAVTAGIPILLVLFTFASANISSLSSALSDAPLAHTGFFIALVVFEIRFYKYWINGTLGQILVETVGIAIVAFLTGRAALGEVMRRRAGKAQQGKH